MIDPGALLDRLGVPYERRGEKLAALCPSPEHTDTSPSWVLFDCPDEPERHGNHRCLACGFHGGPVALVRAVLGCSSKDARRFLRGDGVRRAVPLKVDVEVRLAASLVPVCVRVPPGVSFGPVESWPSGPRDYLFRRGVPALQAEAWRLGYAVDGELGGRVFIPTLDEQQRLVDWSGRDWTGDVSRRRPKYKNATAEDGRDPSAVFGCAAWSLPGDGPPRGESRLVLVEGQLNGLAAELHRTRLSDRFGCLHGSELHPGRLSRFATWGEILVATDADAAGDRLAAELEGALGRHCRVSRRRPPEGRDLADLAVSEPSALRALLA